MEFTMKLFRLLFPLLSFRNSAKLYGGIFVYRHPKMSSLRYDMTKLEVCFKSLNKFITNIAYNINEMNTIIFCAELDLYILCANAKSVKAISRDYTGRSR
jgi:hypothetical protein